MAAPSLVATKNCLGKHRTEGRRRKEIPASVLTFLLSKGYIQTKRKKKEREKSSTTTLYEYSYHNLTMLLLLLCGPVWLIQSHGIIFYRKVLVSVVYDNGVYHSYRTYSYHKRCGRQHTHIAESFHARPVALERNLTNITAS